MIQLGAVVIPGIVVAYIAQMLTARISGAKAAQMAAAEFDYFQALSEAELTQVSFQLAEQFPQYPYWTWFNILRNLRDYGMMQQPQQPQEPGQQQPRPPADTQRDKQSTTGTSAAVAAVAAALILWKWRR